MLDVVTEEEILGTPLPTSVLLQVFEMRRKKMKKMRKRKTNRNQVRTWIHSCSWVQSLISISFTTHKSKNRKIARFARGSHESLLVAVFASIDILDYCFYTVFGLAFFALAVSSF
jgi:hypothetical protein